MSQHFNFAMGYIDNIIARCKFDFPLNFSITFVLNKIYIIYLFIFPSDWATVVGYLLISRPFIGTTKDSLSHSERLEVIYN